MFFKEFCNAFTRGSEMAGPTRRRVDKLTQLCGVNLIQPSLVRLALSFLGSKCAEESCLASVRISWRRVPLVEVLVDP
jgi:hypothetical protein